MKCLKATRLLQAYLDNELNAAQEKRLGHHLEGCSICRLGLSALMKTNEAMDSWVDVEPHRELVTPVMEILRHEQEAPSALEGFVAFLTGNRRKILLVGANLIILLLVVLKVPFYNAPLDKNIDKADLSSGISRRHIRTYQPSEADPVEMSAYLNNMVDQQNFSPIEKDMLIGNFLNDAADLTESAPQPPLNYNVMRVRRVRIISTYDSKGNPVKKQIIFIQHLNYEKPE